jgi:hypothetical protein
MTMPKAADGHQVAGTRASAFQGGAGIVAAITE